MTWVGARVRDPYDRDHGKLATVVTWDPLSAGLCDVLLRYDDGHECWTATHTLAPLDGITRQTRREAQRMADARALETLRTVRFNLIAEWRQPWPGCEFGKVIVGKSIDAAIADIKGRHG